MRDDNDILEEMNLQRWIRNERRRLVNRDPFYPDYLYRQDHEAEFRALAEVEHEQRYSVW